MAVRLPLSPWLGVGALLSLTIALSLSPVAQAVTPLPPANLAVPNNPPPAEDDYTLGPGDRVRIEVLKAPQYNLETQVLLDGSLSLVQAGHISVMGMTLQEASEAASRQYRSLLRYPVVTLTLTTLRPIKVTVAGEVSRRGSYDLTMAPPDNNNIGSPTVPTLTRALKLAGGITQAADLSRVQIRRAKRGMPEQVYTVNLWDFLNNGDTRQDAVLRDGDSIFVPTTSKLDLNESYQLATTSFSAEKIQPLNVTIVGEVYRPGPHTVESSVRVPTAGVPGEARDTFNQARIFPTLTRAIQTAGGIKPTADIRQVEVRRITQDGTEQSFKIDLWALLQSGDQKQDLILQDRDTIVIPRAKTLTEAQIAEMSESSFAPDFIRVNVAGEVDRPGVIQVPPGTTLSKAILIAGGYNRRADHGPVDFIRINADGTATKRRIAVNFAAGADEKINPTLHNEDVIVVRRSGFNTVIDEAANFLNPIGFLRTIFGF